MLQTNRKPKPAIDVAPVPANPAIPDSTEAEADDFGANDFGANDFGAWIRRTAMGKPNAKQKPALTWRTATNADDGWHGVEKLRDVRKRLEPGRQTIYSNRQKIDKSFHASLELMRRGADGEGHHVRHEAARLHQRIVILASVGTGASLATAAKQAGISYETLKAWRRAGAPGFDADFAAAIEKMRAEKVQQAESVLWRCAMQAPHNPRYQAALFFFLKTRAGYREKGEFDREDFEIPHPDHLPTAEPESATTPPSVPTPTLTEMTATIAELTHTINQLRNAPTTAPDGILPILPD